MKFTYFSYCRYHFTKEFIITQIKETLPNFISYLSWFTGFTCLCSCNVICWLDACINCRYYEGTSNVAPPDIYLFETIRLFLTSHTCFGKNSVVDKFPRVIHECRLFCQDPSPYTVISNTLSFLSTDIFESVLVSSISNPDY